MCGRYTLIANAEAIRQLFEVLPFDERLAVTRYNIAPTQPIVVVRAGDRGRELVPMRWGLIPAWTKDLRSAPLLINARAEGIATKPAFQHAFRRRRCLVPATGFYEWQAPGRRAKQPYAVRPADGRLVAFAGVWETWFGPDGSEIDGAAIVTVSSNGTVSVIHDRMPALIAPEDFDAWLSGEADTAAAAALLEPAPEELFICVPVSTRVNAAANDDAALWDEATEPTELVTQEPRQASLF
jgi:putative SOS response-associated peptidase YedK